MSDAQLREAARGFTLMLRRKRFSPRWIEENASDLLAQANSEYAEKLAKGSPADNPAGWLIVCAWRRAQNLLDSQRRTPRPSSLEAAFHVADESIPTPEEQAIQDERQERLRKALSHLPAKDCKLLALVYFEDHSIREAGRQLGWQKSAADRHHTAAMERLRALVGADRSLLSPATLGLGVWVVAIGAGNRPWTASVDTARRSARETVVDGAELAAIGIHRFGEMWRKFSPLSEPGNAAAVGGAGRTAGYCGAAGAAVVCGLAATGAVGPGASAVVLAPPPEPKEVRTLKQTGRPASSQPVITTQAVKPSPPERRKRAEKPKVGSADRAQREKRQVQTSTVPLATSQQTVEEFGVDRGSGSTPQPPPVEDGTPSASSGSSSGSGPPPTQRGASVPSEFEM